MTLPVKQNESEIQPRNPISPSVRFAVLKRDDFKCVYCKSQDAALEVDHIVPHSKGGPCHESNYVTACNACNIGKGDKSLSPEQVKFFKGLAKKRELVLQEKKGYRSFFKPVIIRGVKYESQTAAARKLGVTPNAIRNAIKIGTLDNVGLGKGVKGKTFFKRNKPITLGGVTYNSRREAADKLGISTAQLYRYIREGLMGEFLKHGKLLEKKADTTCFNGKSLVVRGKLYKSIKDCANGEGVNYSTARRHFINGTEDLIGRDNTKSTETVIRGVKYKSIKDAANDIGVCASTIREAIKHNRLETVGLGYASERK